jgi:hypothetical protein
VRSNWHARRCLQPRHCNRLAATLNIAWKRVGNIEIRILVWRRARPFPDRGRESELGLSCFLLLGTIPATRYKHRTAARYLSGSTHAPAARGEIHRGALRSLRSHEDRAHIEIPHAIYTATRHTAHLVFNQQKPLPITTAGRRPSQVACAFSSSRRTRPGVPKRLAPGGPDRRREQLARHSGTAAASCSNKP